jgi:hypothetical protein
VTKEGLSLLRDSPQRLENVDIFPNAQFFSFWWHWGLTIGP